VLPSVKVTVRPSAFSARGRRVIPRERTARQLVPITVSGLRCSRRPMRESAGRWMRRALPSHQNRSLLSGRCGSIIGRLPIATATRRPASASSSAIWKPELPAPTTSTEPSGTSAGRR
jgi:hypothetical protein